MPQVLISEPSAEVRQLFALVISRLGYEAVLCDGESPAPLADVDVVLDADVLLVEPALANHLAFAQEARRLRPDLPIVCASIYPRTPEVAALQPDAFLIKPFGLAELESALHRAIARAEARAAA